LSIGIGLSPSKRCHPDRAKMPCAKQYVPHPKVRLQMLLEEAESILTAGGRAEGKRCSHAMSRVAR
jgi:hypothetical protein